MEEIRWGNVVGCLNVWGKWCEIMGKSERRVKVKRCKVGQCVKEGGEGGEGGG